MFTFTFYGFPGTLRPAVGNNLHNCYSYVQVIIVNIKAVQKKKTLKDFVTVG